MIKMISEFKEGEHISGQFLISNCSRGVNNYGAAYLNLELRDATGSINAKKWEVAQGDEELVQIGNVIYVEAESLKYKESLQLKVLAIKAVPLEEINVEKFLKQPPLPKEVLVEKFNNYVASVTDPDCKKLLEYFVNKNKDKLYEYPAAVSIHHEYICGLLMHSTSMADSLEHLSKLYNCNRDLVITGALLHDMGKLIELEGPIVFHYSTEGKLIGHISIMAAEIKKAGETLGITSEVPMLLQHMILSHHGQLEFGSPIMPLTKEALLLSLVDNLDSKMVVVNKALETTKEGEFSQKVFSLDNRSFYNPKN